MRERKERKREKERETHTQNERERKRKRKRESIPFQPYLYFIECDISEIQYTTAMNKALFTQRSLILNPQTYCIVNLCDCSYRLQFDMQYINIEGNININVEMLMSES